MEQKDIDEMNAKFSEFVEWQKGFSKRVLWKKSNVPDGNAPVRQTTPLTKVMVRDYTESVWQEGLFIEYDESSEDHPFRCVVAEKVLWWNFCEIIKE